MGDSAAFRWDADDVERAESGDDDAPRRAKPVVRRGKVAWVEREGSFRAAIGRFDVIVGVPPGSLRWEWSAFAQGAVPRALRCKGFAEPEAAQRDAEVTLSALS